jgi:hypothetical protein
VAAPTLRPSAPEVVSGLGVRIVIAIVAAIATKIVDVGVVVFMRGSLCGRRLPQPWWVLVWGLSVVRLCPLL